MKTAEELFESKVSEPAKHNTYKDEWFIQLSEFEELLTEHNSEIIEMIDEITPSCKHKGCYNHITHPCEGCGRIQGRITLTELKNKLGEK